MAKYKLGQHRLYRDGVVYPARSTITLPDDGAKMNEPSVTWEPLDDAAKAAIAKVQARRAEKAAATAAVKAPGADPKDFQKAVDAAVTARLQGAVDAAVAAALAAQKPAPAVVVEPAKTEAPKEPEAPKGKRASDKSTI